MLRTRITLVAVGAAAVAILITVVLSYRATVPVIAGQIDRNLSDRVDTVLALLDTNTPVPARADTTEQLVHPDGTVTLLTPGRDPLPVTDIDREIARSGQGEAHIDSDDGHSHTQTKGRPGGGAVMVSQNLSDIARVDREFLTRTAWITGTALAAAALLCWLAIGGILRPIRRLAAATARIATTQDLSVTLPGRSRGEVGELTGNFNTMLAALRLSRAQQQRLAQDAGHELRTPLTSVRGSAELLQRANGRLAPEDETTVLATLVHEARALDDLVRELVDLATDQYATEEAVPLDLAELAEDCAARSRRRTGRSITVRTAAPGSGTTAQRSGTTAPGSGPTARKSGTTATGSDTTAQESGTATVHGRPRALARSIDNLLDNAAKYSPPETPIEVEVTATGVMVRDHGPGIPAPDRGFVFERFYRADTTRATPGSGLGLAIVHDVVAAHGGQVHVGNHPGGGAIVGFELPGASR
ncbi:HAMP domain-containing histidine kinase [Nocardia sp. 2]|uniref:histidine kinase n=1 Tax=Nocardia acididurans TaxID=2802282 RepID=A0ABS1MDB6_9NOCA|nr:HAMP domain-containing sensor histidine kinase [Nocardia acididurans]MBL1077724.1 HAMP domain-containing histidine kinase [Nocardia acididurans]